MHLSGWYDIHEGCVGILETDDETTALIYETDEQRVRYEPIPRVWVSHIKQTDPPLCRGAVSRLAANVKTTVRKHAESFLDDIRSVLRPSLVQRTDGLLSAIADRSYCGRKSIAVLLAAGALDVVLAAENDTAATSRMELLRQIDLTDHGAATHPTELEPSAVEHWFADARRRYTMSLPITVSDIPLRHVDGSRTVTVRTLSDP